MALMKITGGADLPNPERYEVTCIDGDSDNTTRNDNWVLHREVVRSGIYQIDATWKISQSKLKALHKAISVAKVPLTFYNPCTGGYTQASMYSADRKAGCLVLLDDKSPENSTWEYSTTLTIY